MAVSESMAAVTWCQLKDGVWDRREWNEGARMDRWRRKECSCDANYHVRFVRKRVAGMVTDQPLNLRASRLSTWLASPHVDYLPRLKLSK